MSELKCPFCQQELEDANIHSSGLYFECLNCYMKQKGKDDNYTATPRIWQELIRTRKALDVAMAGLEKMTWGCDSSDAEHLLKEITALEQKDVK